MHYLVLTNSINIKFASHAFDFCSTGRLTLDLE